MFLINRIQQIMDAGTQQLITWVTAFLPQIFLFLILLNAITRLIGRVRVEKLAQKCSSNAFLRYMVLPFLSAVVLGNPMAISMGRYLPEKYKPAYFASASYHCHTNSGLFQHINPAELFIWLGIANGVLSRGLDLFPLAVRYLCAGLVANFISGYATELITKRVEKQSDIRLQDVLDLAESHGPEDQPDGRQTDPGTAVSQPGLPAGTYRSITIVRGDGGYGGPVTITPSEERHTVLYMTGGGLEPEPLSRILALSGMNAVNGNQETIPDEEVALAIIDCGGTLRCGIYPGKGIPTANLMATGKSGPLARYMTEDLYVSAVTSAQVLLSEAEDHKELLSGSDGRQNISLQAEKKAPGAAALHEDSVACAADDRALPGRPAPLQALLKPASAIGRIVSVFHQAARDCVRTCLEMLLPFMGFAALFAGICRGSGLTPFLASLLQPTGGSLAGLLGLGIICSIPGLSAFLGAGAVAAQMFSTVIGDLIASGSMSPALALPALFAINCQCACDFIPVGLGMTEAKPETTQVGITAVTISRFATGWIRILIALVFSIGLYR